MSLYKCPKCNRSNLSIERRPDGDITCLHCKYKGSFSQFMDREHQLEEIIIKWQMIWMNVQGTDEKDRENYLSRANGIDANMRFSLARMLDTWMSIAEFEKQLKEEVPEETKERLRFQRLAVDELLTAPRADLLACIAHHAEHAASVRKRVDEVKDANSNCISINLHESRLKALTSEKDKKIEQVMIDWSIDAIKKTEVIVKLEKGIEIFNQANSEAEKREDDLRRTITLLREHKAQNSAEIQRLRAELVCAESELRQHAVWWNKNDESFYADQAFTAANNIHKALKGEVKNEATN